MGHFKLAAAILVFAGFMFLSFYSQYSSPYDETATAAAAEEESYSEELQYVPEEFLDGDERDMSSLLVDDEDTYEWKTNKYNLTAEESCTFKNLFVGKPYVQEIRDQKATGWCYSFGMADILSYQEGRRVSAVGIASALINLRRVRGSVGEAVWNTSTGRAIIKKLAPDLAAEDSSIVQENQAQYDHLIDGASTFITPMLGSYLTGGYCDESTLNDDALMELIRIVKSDPKWYGLFEKIRVLPMIEKEGMIAGEGAHGTAPVVKVRNGQAPPARTPEEARAAIRELLTKAGFKPHEIQKLAALNNMQTSEPLAAYKDALCPDERGPEFVRKNTLRYQLGFNWLRYSFQWKGSVQLKGNMKMRLSGANTPAFIVRPQTRGVPHRYLYEVHEALENNVPASIAHDVGAVWTSPHRPAQHLSVIAGRRWNKQRGQCEFLVKNSWGPGGSYKPEKATRVPKDWPGQPGNWDGYYWMPETSFVDAMRGPKLPNGKYNWWGEVFWMIK